MSERKLIVLDANILIRACLGSRVLHLLEQFEESVAFYSPEACFSEAQKHIGVLFQRRGLDAAMVLSVLKQLRHLVQPISLSLYHELENAARKRIADRDPTDWHVVAAAPFLKCPIWTEDKDFFGAGVPTWTTNRIEVYIEETSSPATDMGENDL